MQINGVENAKFTRDGMYQLEFVLQELKALKAIVPMTDHNGN